MCCKLRRCADDADEFDSDSLDETLLKDEVEGDNEDDMLCCRFVIQSRSKRTHGDGVLLFPSFRRQTMRMNKELNDDKSMIAVMNK